MQQGFNYIKYTCIITLYANDTKNALIMDQTTSKLENITKPDKISLTNIIYGLNIFIKIEGILLDVRANNSKCLKHLINLMVD